MREMTRCSRISISWLRETIAAISEFHLDQVESITSKASKNESVPLLFHDFKCVFASTYAFDAAEAGRGRPQIAVPPTEDWLGE